LLFTYAVINVSWYVNQNQLPQIFSNISKIPFWQLTTGYNDELEKRTASNKNARVLPPSFLKEIGNSPVDILPWEQTFILYNDLNYRPRPVFQTYIAYTPFLDSLNARFYNSDQSPEYLLLSHHTVDTRNPMWEETATKLAMLENYTVTESAYLNDSTIRSFYTAEQPPMIALLRKDKPKLRSLKLIKKETHVLPEDYVINIPKTNNIVILSMDFGNNIPGKIRDLLYQCAVVEASVLINDTWSRKYRFFSSTLKGGIIINKSVLNTEELLKFLSDKTSGLQDISKISIGFDVVRRYIKVPVNYTLEEYAVTQ
jgi:hypothetical protein